MKPKLTPLDQFIAARVADKCATPKVAVVQDNSYGAGYYPLPPKLAGLGRFAECLKPANLVDHKVFPEEGIHMLTAKVNTRFSIMVEDMKVLIRLGFLRMQSNEAGTVAFYFYEGDGPTRLLPTR